MIITIHQPEHLPYFGFLDKVNKADKFVILDDVQFKKNNYQNRNMILTSGGPKWLSIPVEMKGLEDKSIRARKTRGDWKNDYRNKVVESYRKHPYFEENMEWIDAMLHLDSELLIDYNLFVIKELFDRLEIKAEIIYSSDLNIQTQKTQRLYDICKKLDAKAYLAGQGAIDYLDEDEFKADVELEKHGFNHPVYTQYGSKNEFEGFMSCLDILMNVGKEGLKEMLAHSKNQ